VAHIKAEPCACPLQTGIDNIVGAIHEFPLLIVTNQQKKE